jgi:competence protein ComFB
MRNLIEEIVAREYERLLPTVGGFCGCDACRTDVLVYALNRLPPRYTAQHEGEVITNVSLQGHQNVADMSVALLDGFRRVQANPREGHSKIG